MIRASGQETSVDQGAKLKKAQTAFAEIYYLENGPADGSPVLRARFPGDPAGFDSEVIQSRAAD